MLYAESVMARKRIKVTRRMLLTWFILAGFILLLAPHNLTNKLQFAFARIFRLPLNAGRSISLAARTSKPLTDVVSRSEYVKLQNHLANVIQQRDQAYQKLKTLSGFYNKYPYENVKFVLADVVKNSNTELFISCGQDRSLAKGQFVLGDNSIIGTISDVWERTAQVILITSPKSKLAVRIGRLNVDTVMVGDGNGNCRIRLIPVRFKVKIGDEIFVRRAAGLLNAPMIVGRVSRCGRDDANPMLWNITVKPVCDMDKLNDVAVIVMNQ